MSQNGLELEFNIIILNSAPHSFQIHYKNTLVNLEKIEQLFCFSFFVKLLVHH